MTPLQKLKEWVLENYHPIEIANILDKIEELLPEEREGEWIPVTPETMPNEDILVQLVYHGTVQHMPYAWDGNAFRGLDDDENNVIFKDEVSHFRYLNITPPSK